MRELTLAAEMRTGSGKSVTRKLRAAGKTPAVVYGLEKEPKMLTVSSHEMTHLLYTASGEHLLLDLVIGTSRPEKVLVKEVQHHPVTSGVVHVDFLRIDPTKKIEISVMVHVSGTAEGVKAGGVLEFVRRELDVSCLPADIPEHILIDVSHLKIGDAIHVSEVKVDKVEILTPGKQTIVTVVPPVVVKEAAPAAEAVEGAVEAEATQEPEVITAKKKEEEEK